MKKSEEKVTMTAVKKVVHEAMYEIITFIGEQREQIITETRQDITQFKDEILHEIVNLRDDMTVVTGYGDRIENHEIRIEKLEKATTN